MHAASTSLFSRLLLTLLQKKSFIVFGDSHALTFANIEEFDVVHVGPATAHNLVTEQTTTQAREKILATLANRSSLDTAIVLAFGEIDCRMHIIKAASSTELTLLQAVTATVERYASFVKTIVDLGYRVLVYGPAGTGTGWNPTFPSVGREYERNYSTHLFNSLLAAKCRRFGAAFASIDDIVIDKQNWQTRSGFLSDGCHLHGYPNTAAELQSVILSRFVSWLQTELCPHRESQFATTQVRWDHACEKPFLLTSSWNGNPGAGIVRHRAPFFFHTDLGINEGIHIDLLSAYVVDEIVIHNRTDTCQERANHMCLALGLNQQAWSTEAIDTPEGFLTGQTLIISKRFKPLLARHAFLFSTTNTYLHLSKIELFGFYPAAATVDQGAK